MPTRSPPPPRTLPSRKIITRRLPQNKIQRISLVRSNFYPGSSYHIVNRAAGKRTIAFKAFNREEDMTLCFISMTRLNKILDHFYHFSHIVCGSGHLIRQKVAKKRHIFQVPSNSFIRYNLYFFAKIFCSLVNLVVDICKISHIFYIIITINFPKKPE